MPLLDTLTDSQSQAPPSRGSSHGHTDDTAQPSLTSGFDAVLDRERNLQKSVEACHGIDNGIHTTPLRQVLREQAARLSSNIALLEQRYEAFPRQERFRSRGPIASGIPAAADARTDSLRPLIVQHENLLADIAALMERRADGQRGKLILTEVARGHAAMAGALTAFAFPDTTVRDAPPALVVASSATSGPNAALWRRHGTLPVPRQSDFRIPQPAGKR